MMTSPDSAKAALIVQDQGRFPRSHLTDRSTPRMAHSQLTITVPVAVLEALMADSMRCGQTVAALLIDAGHGPQADHATVQPYAKVYNLAAWRDHRGGAA